jgi:hypothetical protein
MTGEPRTMRRGGRLILFGIGLASIALIVWLDGHAGRMPAAQVARCEPYWSHGWNLKLTMRDGSKLDVRPAALGSTGDCLRAGAVVEKRRWEGAYRVDGSLVDDFGAMTTGLLLMGILAILLVAVGVALERRGGKPAPGSGT